MSTNSASQPPTTPTFMLNNKFLNISQDEISFIDRDELSFLDNGSHPIISQHDVKFPPIDHDKEVDKMAIMAQSYSGMKEWNIRAQEMRNFTQTYAAALGTTRYTDHEAAALVFQNAINTLKMLDTIYTPSPGMDHQMMDSKVSKVISKIDKLISQLPGTYEGDPNFGVMRIAYSLARLPPSYLTTLLAHTRKAGTSSEEIVQIEGLFQIYISGFAGLKCCTPMEPQHELSWRTVMIPFWNDRAAAKTASTRTLAMLGHAVVLGSKLEIVGYQSVLSAMDMVGDQYPATETAGIAGMFNGLYEHIRFMGLNYGLLQYTE